MRNFNVQELVVSDLGARAGLDLACPTWTEWITCAEPSLAAQGAREDRLTLLQQQLRRALRESQAPF
jgi:hypothetical protein